MLMKKLLLLLGCLSLAGCLGTTEVPNNPSDPTTESFASGLGIDISQMQAVAVGSSFVYIKDLTVGAGPQLTQPTTVVITYATFLKNGLRVDQGAGVPFNISGAIIGFQKGMIGMNVGGERLIVIPSALAYGVEGAPPAIPPNATLVFDVRLEQLP
jgi:FKBP-type peptidyl-prolyl cis-trans isomerase FkpA